MLKRGFSAVWTIKASGDTNASTVVTRGDIQYDESRTEIEVKNAASDEVRYIPGMKATDFSVQVQAGTDPEDAAGFDAYAKLKALSDASEVFESTFTAPGGFTRTKNMVVTKWTDQDPVDGLNVADVTLRVAAGSLGDKFVDGSGSGSGSGSGN